MHDGMPYGRIQVQGQGHSREVDRQSTTGLIFFQSDRPMLNVGHRRLQKLRHVSQILFHMVKTGSRKGSAKFTDKKLGTYLRKGCEPLFNTFVNDDDLF